MWVTQGMKGKRIPYLQRSCRGASVKLFDTVTQLEEQA